jgi:ubiquinone/menaquinone biosynthesis C-methylase UbiE
MDSFEEIRTFYNSNFREFGSGIRSVGWSTVESQRLRYQILLNGEDLRGKSILDLGCGTGALIPIIREQVGDDFRYIGVDITTSFISYCKGQFSQKNMEFIEGNFLEVQLPEVDYVIASGVFTLNVPGMAEYTEECLSKMFRLSRIACAANFLSTQADFELEKNLHYDPTLVLETALQFTQNVILIHGIPKFEFSVILGK